MVAHETGDSQGSSGTAFLDTTFVNRFAGSYDPVPDATVSLRAALESIRGTRYRKEIEQLRHILLTRGKDIYNTRKKNLDAYTFAGIFSPRRLHEYLQRHSRTVHFDYDGLPDVAGVKRVLCGVSSLTYAFTSPSGCGLKVGVRVEQVADDFSYKHAWQAVADHFQTTYGLEVDESGKDVNRLCCASWDPLIYIVAGDPEIFPVPPIPPRIAPRPLPLSILSTPLDRDRRRHYVDQAVARAITIIESSYPKQPGRPGTRHRARLRASTLLGGYVGGGFLTYEEAYSLLYPVVVANTTTTTQAMKTIESGLRYGAETPVTFELLEAERMSWREAHGYASHHGGN